jgi:hypothetical protein
MAFEDKSGKLSRNGQRGEITAQLEWESERRTRLGVPALAGGFLYLFGALIIGEALGKAPTVGLLQGISPALKGVAKPHESPRAPEVRYISHHAFALIAGSVLSAIALLALTAVLFVLVRATKFRRPESWPATMPLALFGGIGFAAVAIAHQIAFAILTHNFATGHDFSNHAVDEAISTNPANTLFAYVSLVAGLALLVGTISACLGAMRCGLLTRWMSVVGIFAALLIFLPIGGETLTLVPAFWLAAMGLLYMGRWPGEEPPAWSTGESRPWPSQAELRARQQAAATADADGSGDQAAGAEPAENGAVAGETTASARSAGGGRRRRKRGSRGT